jgi:hypothetical protein
MLSLGYRQREKGFGSLRNSFSATRRKVDFAAPGTNPGFDP